MKRIVLSIVVLLVLLCGIAVAEERTIVAEGNCGASGSNVTWTLDSEGTLKIKGEGEMEDYSWSSNVPWYSNRESIKTVVIESGVTGIGKDALYGCSSLTSITIPDSVTRIGDFAFSDCSSLGTVYIDSLECWMNILFSSMLSTPLYYGGELFIANEPATDLVVPIGITQINDYALCGCSSLTSITIPEGVTSIGKDAFYGCSSLTGITIPEGVTSIGKDAFYGCSSLTGITIPEGVTSIGIGTFYDCSSLTSVELPAGLTSIGSSAFSNCSSLTSITIPYGVTSIGLQAFSNCSSLSSITLPAGLTSIDFSAFFNCTNLSKVYVDSLEGWLNISFSNDIASPLYWGVELYIADELATDLVVPRGITQINDYALCGCSSLTSITIPAGVTSIGDVAFSGCSSLTSIELPAGLTSIGSSAFSNCSSLTSVTIPYGVTSIGSGAFYGCSSLTSVELPAGLASISSSAFSNCSSLTSVELPTGLASIGEDAFSSCSSLTSITIPEGVTSIDDWAFAYCNNLSNIVLPTGLTSIGKYAFHCCLRLPSIAIPEGVTTIGDGAFLSGDDLSSITLSASVSSIGDSAFKCCYDLEKIMFLGNDMPTLGRDVFSTRPTIYCYEFSDVDFWAVDNSYNCVYIDGMDLSRPISIDLPQYMQLEMGESRTITAGLFPQTATAQIVWESSNLSIVSVEDGVLTAHAVGEATITASCDNISDQMTVRVYAPVESFELSEAELWVVSKQSTQLDICNIEPVGATAFFYWESSDTSVLTVDEGSVAALKPGDATVTVTSDNGIVRTCLVHVCYPVTGIELERSEYQMCLDGNVQIIANVTMRDQSCVNQLVTFTSSDETVATVDQTGRIHAVSPGTATITVSATSGVSATCTVEIGNCTHTPVTDPAVPATHVTTGLTEGSHCAVCGEILVVQQIVPIVEVEKVVLPAKLEVIEEEAFAVGTFACVVLPEGCKEIGAGAFKNCAQLRFIEIPASVTSIDGSAFEGCSDGLIIVTVSGSEAERFADAHGIPCVLR